MNTPSRIWLIFNKKGAVIMALYSRKEAEAERDKAAGEFITPVPVGCRFEV